MFSFVCCGDSFGFWVSGDFRFFNFSGFVFDCGVSSWGCFFFDFVFCRFGLFSFVLWVSIVVFVVIRVFVGIVELFGEVFGRDLFEDFRLVIVVKDVDFLYGDGVELVFDNILDGGEVLGGVDKVYFVEMFGVVVLGDDGGLVDVGVDLGNMGDGDVFEVDDRVVGFEEVIGFVGVGGEMGVGDVFVFDGEVVEYMFVGGDFVYGS